MAFGITFAGVGGQGILFVSRILSEALVGMGFDVKTAEVHGMAQRGGSVIAQLRFGQKVFSPTMARGESDMLVSFEEAEAARRLPFLKADGVLISSDTRIPTMSMTGEGRMYPEGIYDALKPRVRRIIWVPAGAIADSLGCRRVQNMVVLGALVRELNFLETDWRRILRRSVPDALFEMNARALDAGLAWGGDNAEVTCPATQAM